MVLLGGAMAVPHALCAEQKPTPVIGYLTGRSPGESASIVAAFNQGLNETGHVEGQNVPPTLAAKLLDTELMPKRLEVLSELAPRARAIALLVNPNNPSAEGVTQGAQEASRVKGVQLDIVKASNQREIEMAFASLAQLSVGALVIQGDPYFNSQRDDLVARVSRHAVPAIYAYREYVVSGGLISYAASLTGMWRQVGTYAGKILNGAKPADLPVEQLTKVELVINLKTANALGLAIPPLLLGRADEVIE
jgi:putative ABC transport system substrate-binding protein